MRDHILYDFIYIKFTEYIDQKYIRAYIRLIRGLGGEKWGIIFD